MMMLFLFKKWLTKSFKDASYLSLSLLVYLVSPVRENKIVMILYMTKNEPLFSQFVVNRVRFVFIKKNADFKKFSSYCLLSIG